MSKIHKNQFTSAQAGKFIDLDKLENNDAAQAELADARVSMSQLRRADRNADGLIDAREAWRVADHFDRDGNAASLDATVTDSNGTELLTQAGKTTTVLGALLQRADLQGTPTPERNDDILFVGMGPETRTSAGAKHEIKKLRQGGANVVGIIDSTIGNDKIRVDGTTYDLTTDDGRAGFAQTLGLSPDQTHQVEGVLERTGADGRDEMAQIAMHWSKAEHGETIPSRMVISGHHVGSAVWGDGNGRITWTELKSLAQAMPKAASQVEDLHLSACYSGGQSKRDLFQDIFPNVKTIWAYSGSAPGTGSGATIHQASWERATRGNGGVDDAVASLQRRGIRKSENIDAANVNSTPAASGPSLSELRAEVEQREPAFSRFFTGEQKVQNSQRGPLREYYNHVQNLLQHGDLPATERTELESRRDQTIRVLYYDSHIRHKVESEYGSAIEAGYEALGLDAPHFGELSRGDAMNAIRDFRETLSNTPNAPAAASDLLPTLNGVWNLDPQTIPETWI